MKLFTYVHFFMQQRRKSVLKFLGEGHKELNKGEGGVNPRTHKDDKKENVNTKKN